MMELLDEQVARIRAAFAKPLFFIAGTERSGTTWLQLLMDSHPEIACRGEGHLIDHLFPKLDEALEGYRTAVGRFNQSYFKDTAGFPTLDGEHEMFLKRMIVGSLLAAYEPPDGCKVIGEKTPGNIRHLNVLNTMFPGCRFVFIVRDGRDVAVSLWHHGRQNKSGDDRPPLDDLTRRLAKSWCKDIKRARDFADDHPDRTCIVRYEDLHGNPQDALRGIFEFLGVDTGAEAIEASIAGADFKKFSGGRSRGEEDKKSQFRKGIVGDWRNHDEADINAIFRDIAADYMDEYDYR